MSLVQKPYETSLDGIENTWLMKYYDAIQRGEIIAGEELKTELENLIYDFEDPKFYYDTRVADFKIDFMENCVKLTKSPFYGKPMILMLWQKAFIEVSYSFKMSEDGTDRFRRVLLLIARKNTKALDVNTRIPTPEGDKTILDIDVGDLVYNAEGKPVSVTGISEIFKNRKCYELTFEDGEKIICDENHKWTVQTKDTRRRSIYVSKSKRKSRCKYPLDDHACITVYAHEMINDFMRIRKDGKGKEYKYRVPVPNAIEYPKKELFNPYVLGLWLGDGDKHDNRITCGKEDLSELLKQLKKENINIESVKNFNGGYEVRIGKRYAYHKHDVREALRNLNVWENKHIPEEYLTASISQRMELLKGLMDTDGTCSKAGQCSFTQKSEIMIDGFSKLLSSLGIKHTIHKIKIPCNEKICEAFTIRFWVSKNNSCFRYKRKHERLKDSLNTRMNYKSIIDIKEVSPRDTKCITVDDKRGLFLCGERNTVTHNSETCSGLGLTELITGADGEDIVCSSNDDTQANILYEAINTMRLMIDPLQKDTWKNQQWIKCMINGSKVFKLSDRTRNKEGRNIDFAIVDECHEMKDNVIVKSIEQSQSLKPNPKLILITTEGFVNGGFLDEELKRARSILNGEDDSLSAERYLPWLYTQDSEAEVWTDETSWEKSNPTIGKVKRWDYLREQVDAARKSKADRMFTLSKDFNFKVSNSEAWLMGEFLEYSRVFNLDDFRGTICLGGVDLAETTDLCSAKIMMLKPDDNTKYIHQMYWMPESKLELADDAEAGAKYEDWARNGLIRIVEGNDVDVSLIADWFAELYKEFKIRIYKTGYDQRFAKDFVKRMNDYGFETEIINQNRYVLSNPMRLVESEIKQHLINYNDNPIDKWCLANTAVQVWDTGHIMPVKIKGQSGRRIDGTLSLIDVYEMYRRYRTDINELIQRI